jgi:alcohol dehydrogenase (cytochrome c)
MQGNRSGFFYVFGRVTGKLLPAKKFLKELTWAKGIGSDGRPILVPGQEPSAAGTRVCPLQDGATKWYSPSLEPGDRPLLQADQRKAATGQTLCT